jgi:peptide/nickel transport system substrate-binding protein
MASGAAEVQLLPGESKAAYDELMGGVATLREVPGQWNMALRFNLSRPDDDDPGPYPPHPILGDLRVRQALAHAINYGAIIFQVNPGAAPVTTPLAYGWYQCDQPRVYRYNQARARYLLEQAGWVEGEDGMRVAQGVPALEDGTRLSLRLQGYADFQPLVDLEEALVRQFAAVGVEVVVQNDPMEVIFGSYADGARRKLGNFDMLLYDASLPIEPQTVISTTFHSTSIPSPENLGGGNYMRWANPAADAAIEAAGSSLDLETRQQAYCELARLVAEDVPQVHFYVFSQGYGVSRRLRGFTVNRWGSLTWDVQNWKLDPPDEPR